MSRLILKRSYYILEFYSTAPTASSCTCWNLLEYIHLGARATTRNLVLLKFKLLLAGESRDTSSLDLQCTRNKKLEEKNANPILGFQRLILITRQESRDLGTFGKAFNPLRNLALSGTFLFGNTS